MASSRQLNTDYTRIGNPTPTSVAMPTKLTTTQACDRCRSKKVIWGVPHVLQKAQGATKQQLQPIRTKHVFGDQSTASFAVPHLESAAGNPSPHQVYPSSTTVPGLFLTDLELAPPSADRDSSSRSQHASLDIQLSIDEERQIIETFFSHVQPSIPLLLREPFMQRYERGDVDLDLLRTLLAVVTKLRGISDAWKVSSPESYLRRRLDDQVGDEQTISSFATLDMAQESCLLAYYEFHQYPGHRAWLRIGRLVRGAYIRGLHQLDNKNQRPLYDSKPFMEDEREEWRHIWWWIYCLDSYSNITAATPFSVEVESIGTALLSTHPSLHGQSATSTSIFLPPEADVLWTTVQEIVARGRSTALNLQIVSQTALRRAATLARLWRLNPSDRLNGQLELLENHVSAFRLALPVRYLRPSRDVASNESSSNHHARLVFLLELHVCRLMITLCLLHKNESEWLRNWQASLEMCEDVVSIVRHWDPKHCTSVDPATCLLILRTLILIHLHGKQSTKSELELKSKLSSYEDLLLLFMGHFATTWNLPSFLINSFNKLRSVLPSKLSSAEIRQFLRHHQGLLHQSWFKLVSLEPDSVHPQIQLEPDTNLPSEWDLIDWTSWANIPRLNFD
ncbi:uncharacterized protein A1O9_11394 [Exophiala aquamarina CBS 119918]|uniref:Xylanolytic transcriptional activator regulatory domain-containing protein n=1 Tax=Exophiala aquamarina CBS 119918 TaxID=1182545 RepID=A0A072NYQ9_9EURO|nr:uncharacterized protein A1O9_11394 [Exophiala aquamarina CBS 119918]KEF52552.1 hypothetical protein A1O9_11394 [Exophiala aquamarina CBS 119918]